MPSPADVLPPSKRVAVPNLRAGLDEDLAADFAAAVGDGFEAALGEHLAIGAAFVMVSLARGYLLRRLFERWRNP